MRYNVIYQRKVRTKAYEMLEIGLSMEFDTATTPLDQAFLVVKSKVEEWLEKERDRILSESVSRPKKDDEEEVIKV